VFLADPGETRGCSTNTFVRNSFSHLLDKISLPAPVEDGAFRNKRDYVSIL
jgi:hypothetical protein